MGGSGHETVAGASVYTTAERDAAELTGIIDAVAAAANR